MPLKVPKQFFVTATDTNVGKTTITRLLIEQLQAGGFSAIGCKPVACGYNHNNVNEDVLLYEQINSLQLTRIQINPVCFELPASPHLAADANNKKISLADITNPLKELQCLSVDYIFYEGAGGWKVPLNETETMADLALSLECPIIFVVGIRVGCMNHALLTWDAMKQAGANVFGWIANVIDPHTPLVPQHILSLQQQISAPYLGWIPHIKNIQMQYKNFLNIELIENSCHLNTN